MKKTDMLQGNMVKNILWYTLPLILGSVFQLLYSTVDMMVVGDKCSTVGIDAVGDVTPIINVMSFLIIGLCNGASILMSEFYGSGDESKFHKEVAVCISAITVFSALLSILAITLAKPLLTLINIRSELVPDATSYLVATSCGLVFVGVYNVYSAALRSIGDSQTPLLFLIVSCFLNIGLDVLFVYAFNLGVLGVAIATVISQFVSMTLCIIYCAKTRQIFRFAINDFAFDGALLKRTSSYAVASALQQVVLHLGKSMVQGNINKLELNEQAGFNIGTKIDDYALTPFQCIGNATAVFVAQNRGAQNTHRAKRGYIIGLVLEWTFAIAVSVFIYLLKTPLVTLFTDQAEVISQSVTYISVMCFLYLMPATTNGVQSYFRGLGKLRIVFWSTVVQIIFRVGFAYYLVPVYGVAGGAYCTFFGWLAMLLFEVPILIYYYKTEKGLAIQE